MVTAHRLVATLLIVSALSACVSAPQRPATATAPTTTRSVAVTGSHLPVPVDRRTGLPQSSLPIQSVSQEELKSTGQDDPAQALRMLVPIAR